MIVRIRVHEVSPRRMPRRRERRANSRNRALVRAIAVHDLELLPIDEGNSRRRDSARARDPALDLVAYDVNPEPPIALERITHDRIPEGDPRVYGIEADGVPRRIRVEQRIAATELAGRGVARGLSETCIRAVAGGLDCYRLCRCPREAVSHHRVRRQRINPRGCSSLEKRGEGILDGWQPVRRNLWKPEIIFLAKPTPRHVVNLDVQCRTGR